MCVLRHGRYFVDAGDKQAGPLLSAPVTAPLGHPARHSDFGLEFQSLHEPLPIHMTNAIKLNTERRASILHLRAACKNT